MAVEKPLIPQTPLVSQPVPGMPVAVPDSLVAEAPVEPLPEVSGPEFVLNTADANRADAIFTEFITTAARQVAEQGLDPTQPDVLAIVKDGARDYLTRIAPTVGWGDEELKSVLNTYNLTVEEAPPQRVRGRVLRERADALAHLSARADEEFRTAVAEAQKIKKRYPFLKFNDILNDLRPSLSIPGMGELAEKVGLGNVRDDGTNTRPIETAAGEMFWQAVDEISRIAPEGVALLMRAGRNMPVVETGPGGRAEIEIVPNPWFDEEAEEVLNDGGLRGALKGLVDERMAGIARWKLPGAQALENVGVKPIWAELIMTDALDPAAWLLGGPLVFVAGKAAITGTYRAARVTKDVLQAAQHFKRVRYLLDGQELGVRAMLDMKRLREGLEIIGLEGQGAKITNKNLQKLIAQLEESGDKDKVGELLGTFFKPQGGRTRQQALAWDKKQLKALREMSPAGQKLFVQTRIQMARNASELKELQLLYGSQKWADNIPTEWWSRANIFEEYYHHASNTVIRVDGGVMADAMRNPHLYFKGQNVVERMSAGPLRPGDGGAKLVFRADGKGRALMRGVGAKDVNDVSAFDRLRTSAYIGRDPAVRQARIALEKGRKVLRDHEVGELGANLSGIRGTRNLLRNTGVHSTVIQAKEISQAAREARHAQVAGIFGGRGEEIIPSLWGMMRGGGRRVRVTKQVVKKGTRVGKLGRSARDLNDEVYAVMGGEDALKWVNQERALHKLPELRKSDISEDSVRMGEELRAVLDDMFTEAVDIGAITPGEYLTEYLPMVRRAVSGRPRGQSSADAIASLHQKMIRKGRTDMDPFFTMVRSGELAPDEFNVPSLIDKYARSLYKAKYETPVMDDLVRIATDPRATMGNNDRVALLDWVFYQRGGLSASQTSSAASINKMNNMNFRLNDDDIFGKGAGSVRELLQNPVQRSKAVRYMSRQWTGMMYAAALGGKSLLAFRNTEQLALGLNRIGNMRSGKYLGRATADMWTNDAALMRYGDSARGFGWHKNWGEFIAEAAADLPRDIVPPGFRDFLTYLYRAADGQNRMLTYRATELAVEDMFKWKRAADPKRANEWRKYGKKMHPGERQIFERAMLEDDLVRARRVASEAAVNDSQWLYHPGNRPMGFASRGTLKQAVFDSMYLFLSWPSNFGENFIAGMRAGRIGKEGFAKERLGEMEGAGRFIMQLSLLSVGADAASEMLNLPVDLSFRNLPDTPDWQWYRDGFESLTGIEKGGGVLRGGKIPLAIGPGTDLLGSLFETAQGAETPIVLVNTLTDFFTGVAQVGEGLMSDDKDVTQQVMNDLFKATPPGMLAPRNTFLRPAGQYFADEFLQLPSFAVHRTFTEKWLAAAFGFQELSGAHAGHGIGQETLEAQGGRRREDQ